MYKYEVDPTRTEDATERTQDAGRTDGRSETNIPPNNFVVGGGGGGGYNDGNNNTFTVPTTLTCFISVLWFFKISYDMLSHEILPKADKPSTGAGKNSTCVVKQQLHQHLV